MTYRDEDDDTSTGRLTQGGSAPRRGRSIWWMLALAVIVVAVAVAVATLPKKRAVREEQATGNRTDATTVALPSPTKGSAKAQSSP